MSQHDSSYAADIVVVGAGTAGCVLAARLSENKELRVLLVEAGADDSNRWIDVPFGMQMLVTNPAVNWMYESQPVPGVNNRRFFEPRGKVVGGTGNINASLYVRGNAADYDGWRDAGCIGWAYADVLPYFRRSENQERGADAYHGADGPMWVSDGPGDALSRAFLAAIQEKDLPLNPDFNGECQDGFGRFQTTTRHNRRHSTARAYLDVARGRPNLQILTDTLVSRVCFEGGRATGVVVQIGGAERSVTASRQVILCGGTFNSPQVLERSGIGDGKRLQSIGIPVVAHVPGVGKNLQEHFGAKVIYQVRDPAISLNRVGGNLARKAAAFAQYVARRRGALAWTNTFVGGFARSHAALHAPDIQVTVNAWSARGISREGMLPHAFPGITFNAYHLTPESRGEVHAISADPQAAPDIRLAALETQYDRSVLRAGIRLVQGIVDSQAFRAIGASPVEPGAADMDDEALDAFVREKMTCMWHPVGSCRMGSDEGAVVDPKLLVRGVQGLRVVDSSVMPTLPRGNTNAPTVMIAERASSLILQDLRRA